MTTRKNILILGGGYAGIMAALRLAGKTKRWRERPTVTLINGLDHFVERPRLHEQATGTTLAGRPITAMLRGSGALFVQGWVQEILPDAQQVVVATADTQQHLPYDKLIIALGSRVDRATVPGVAEHAFTLDPYGDLTTAALQTRLASFGQRLFRAVVVGGGATGLEAATQIKGLYAQSEVMLVTQGEAGAFKGARIQSHIQQALAEQAIQLHEHSHVLAVEADAVVLGSERLPADVVLWAGGFVANPLAREAGIMVNGRCQIKTDPFLRSLSHANIYAVGDSAFPLEEPGAPIRMSLFTALVSGAQAADNIIAELKGKQGRPLSFAWYGQGIALGPKDAVGFPTYPVDQPVGGIIFRGATAVAVRNFFVWFIKASLELERRFPGFLFWNGKKRYAQQQKRNEKQSSAATQL